MLRVLIVDDISNVRRELTMLLELSGGLEIVGEAGDGIEAVRQVEALKPDVVLMDLEMPRLDGFAATRQIKTLCPNSRVVILSVHDNQMSRERAKEAGMDDFVVKGATLESILQAITMEKSRENGIQSDCAKV